MRLKDRKSLMVSFINLLFFTHTEFYQNKVDSSALEFASVSLNFFFPAKRIKLDRKFLNLSIPKCDSVILTDNLKRKCLAFKILKIYSIIALKPFLCLKKRLKPRETS